jgi:acyl carrier protein
MTHGEIQLQVQDFVQRNFVFNGNKTVALDDSLIGTGVVDSTGVLELIGFLEDHYSIHFDDKDLVVGNFDSISQISLLVSQKL